MPTVDGSIPISVKARNLNVTHLGKEFIGRGVLESFSITGRLNDDGSRTVTVDVSFGGVHYRFDPETQLEYLRPNQNEQNL